MTRHWPGMAVTLLAALLCASSASAQAADFSNTAPTTLNKGGSGSPYPSQITVSGMGGTVSKVTATLTGVTWDQKQLDIMLVSPTGQTVMLSSDVNMTDAPAAGATWTFDDSGSGNQTSGASGTFKPTNIGSDSDDFPGGPSGPGGTTMATFTGDPNGTWKLYTHSNDAPDAGPPGSITTWSLHIETVEPSISITPTALDFGSVQMPGSAATQTVTVTNNGTALMTFSREPSAIGDAVDFPISGSTCHSGLNPGESCTFNVGFVPTAAGDRSASVVISDNAPGGPHSLPVGGIGIGSPPQESGSRDITVQPPTFSGGGTPAVGRPTLLKIDADDPKAAVAGVIVDFGEKQGIFAESACVAGVDKGNQTTFAVPYEFLSPGSHTITVTVFAGGCGSLTSHTYTFTVDVSPAKAALRSARAADTISGPNITSACRDKDLLPSPRNAKRIVASLLCVMNEQRKLAKLKPVKVSKRLSKAATTHSKAMILGQFFAHQGPSEPALVKRLAKVRYIGSAGENLGAGAGSLGTPLAMVNGWMHSSLHRANLLSKKWKTVGIGFLPRFPVAGGFPPVATYTTDFGTKP